MPWPRFLRRLGVLLGLGDPDPAAVIEAGLDRLEDRAWARAVIISDQDINMLNTMITAISSYMGNSAAVEHFVEARRAAGHPAREMTANDFLILNEIASGRINTIN